MNIKVAATHDIERIFISYHYLSKTLKKFKKKVIGMCQETRE